TGAGLRGITHLVRSSSQGAGIAPQRCVHDSVQLAVGWIRHLLGGWRSPYEWTKHDIHVHLGNSLRASRPLSDRGSVFCRRRNTRKDFLRTHQSPGHHHLRLILQDHKFAALADTGRYLPAGALRSQRNDLAWTSAAIFPLELRVALARREPVFNPRVRDDS